MKSNNQSITGPVIISALLVGFSYLTGQTGFGQVWVKSALNPLFSVTTSDSGAWNSDRRGSALESGHAFRDDTDYKVYYGAYDGVCISIGLISSVKLDSGWAFYENNPVLTPGPPGSWDALFTGSPVVVKEGSSYKMWYSGCDGNYLYQIGYATSTDGITWLKYQSNPVLTPGEPGSWDDGSVLAPFVIVTEGRYEMWYHASGGIRREINIGYAISTDGMHWEKARENPVLTKGEGYAWDVGYVAWPLVIKYDGDYLMWYGGSTDLISYKTGFALSEDGIHWKKDRNNNPVLSIGDETDWDARGAGIWGIFVDEDDLIALCHGQNSAYAEPKLGIASFPRSMLRVGEVVVPQVYYQPATDNVPVTARVHDPADLDFTVALESPDEVAIDSVQIFDDGLHGDGADSDSLFGNYLVLPDGERHYWIDVIGSRSATDSTAFIKNNVARFTTIGPLVFDTFEYAGSDTTLGQGEKFYFRIGIRNEGATTTAPDISARISAQSSCIYNIDTDISYIGDIEPGATNVSLYTDPFSITIHEKCADYSDIPIALDIYSEGHLFWSDTFSTQVFLAGTGDVESGIPQEYLLEQNFPNPFNTVTTIRYAVPTRSKVILTVYNLKGAEIARLVEADKQAGYHEVHWNAETLASGIYFYRLQAGDFSSTRKLVLLK